MADGFKVDMDAEKAAQLEEGARRLGLAPAEYARLLLERALEDEADRIEIDARMKRFERDGEAVDHAEVLDLLKKRSAG